MVKIEEGDVIPEGLSYTETPKSIYVHWQVDGRRILARIKKDFGERSYILNEKEMRRVFEPQGQI